jgi:hypothetical protein
MFVREKYGIPRDSLCCRFVLLVMLTQMNASESCVEWQIDS